MEQDELARVWQRVMAELQPHQRAWLDTSRPVTLHETTAIIAVPNEFTRTQLEGRLRGQVEDALSESFGREIRMAVTVDTTLEMPPVLPDPPLIDDTSTSRDVPLSTNVPTYDVPAPPPPSDPRRPVCGGCSARAP